MVRLLIYIQGHRAMRCICRGPCGLRKGQIPGTAPHPAEQGQSDRPMGPTILPTRTVLTK